MHPDHTLIRTGAPHRFWREARSLPVRCALALASLALLTGCFDPETRKTIADNDSLLAPIFQRTTPAVAASWAADPYDADKRARGTLLLANAPFGGADAYLALYRQNLADKEPNVRASSAQGLALHGSPEDVPALAPLLKDKDLQVRLSAARALQRLHNPVAVDPLVLALAIDKEPEAQVRAEAASALGQYPTAKSLQALMASLGDDSLSVNRAALEALRTLTGQDQLEADRKAWVKWSSAGGPGAADPFARQRKYVYPVFSREYRWLDYVPFMPEVPNETAAEPAGAPLPRGT